MAFNSWGNNDDDTSFERGSPVSQTTKNATKIVTSQIKQQQKAFSKAVRDQFYGIKPDENNPQANEVKKEQPPGMETLSKQMPKNTGDEKQIEETRRKLQEFQRTHRENYYEKTFGDSARKKIEQEEQEKKQKELQEEEAKRDAEEKAAQQENLGGVAPQGKTTGRNRMQKPQIALKQATTKTEINRGTTG